MKYSKWHSLINSDKTHEKLEAADTLPEEEEMPEEEAEDAAEEHPPVRLVEEP